MKRNQFLLTVIRLLVNTVFFYVLGVMSGNYIKNNDLLINIDEAFVSSTIDKPVICIENDNSVLFESSNMYTYVQEQVTVAHTMNTIGLLFEQYRTKNLVVKSIEFYARVPNYLLDKPPRSDMLETNTS